MSLEDSGQKSMLLLSTEYKGPLVNDAIYNGTHEGIYVYEGVRCVYRNYSYSSLTFPLNLINFVKIVNGNNFVLFIHTLWSLILRADVHTSSYQT